MITGPNRPPNAVRRVYKTSISNGEWKLWREGQPFNQTHTATISADCNRATATSLQRGAAGVSLCSAT